jgi:integrase
MASKRRQERRKRGSGTIQRQADNTYIARTSDRSRSGRFADRSRAEEALDLWNKQLGLGIDPNESRQSFRDFIRLWLRDVVEPHKRPRTAEFYRRHAGYATAQIGDTPIEAVSTRAIEQMLGKLAGALSPRSVAHVRSVLHNAFQVAHRWYGIENPVKEVPKIAVEEQEERAITAAQVAILLESVREDRLEALWYIALTLGLRRGELLGLRWSDIDFDQMLIHVRQQVSEDKDRKTVIAPFTKARKARPLPMTDDVAAQLRRRQDMDEAEARTRQQKAREKAEREGQPTPLLRWNESGLVFPSEAGTVILPANLNRRLRTLVARINRQNPGALPLDLSPHTLRHTALTDLAAHGEAKAVQNIAGHADIDTTMRVYVGRRMVAMRDAVEKMERGRKTG